MPREAKPTPLQELPSHETILAAATRLEAFSKDPLAKIGLNDAHHASELWEKDVKRVWQDLIKQAGEPPSDLPAQERLVKGLLKVLSEVLSMGGQASEVQSALTTNSDLTSQAMALAAMGKKSTEIEAPALATKLDKALKRLLATRDRVAHGGHQVFDDDTVRIARKIWELTDNSYDLLGVCLRRSGIVNDPVYLNRPTVRTPLRPQLVEAVAAKTTKATKGKAKVVRKPNGKQDTTKQPAAETQPAPSATASTVKS